VIGRIANVFRLPDLRQRILITVGFLLVYRIGANIPIPGIDLDALKRAFAGREEGGAFAQMYNLISGGSIYSCSLFTLGIMPYISASIIFSLLAKVLPSLEKIAKEGSSGQRRINQWTRLATIPLAAIQAAFIVSNVLRSPQLIGQPLLLPGFGYAVTALLALTAGTVLLMWVGEQITEYGVGNGISLMIMAGIIARVPQAWAKLVQEEASALLPTMLLLIFFAIVIVVIYITKGTRKVPVQYAKLTRGRRVYGGQRHFLPIKVNQAGVMPVVFSSALLSFPQILGQALNWTWLDNAMRPASWTYVVLDIVLIYFFSFFWTSLMFNPVEMSKNMKEHGSFIPGIRPGRSTAEFLSRVISRITVAGATFLAIIAIIPQWISSSLAPQSPQIGYFLGGTSILIVVSVALDLVDKLNSSLLMHSYEGFLRGGASSTGRR
jgi:preprotein translocase subunit SecY